MTFEVMRSMYDDQRVTPSPDKPAGEGQRLLGDPANFLHAIDLAADRAMFIPTRRALLGEASFVDGRTNLACGPATIARLSGIARSLGRDPAPARYIFHFAFCGSTLLSRLLDVPGRSLVLKEPNCLVDLANWKASATSREQSLDPLGPALTFAAQVLRRPFALGEAVTVKPSNWANNLIADLLDADPDALPLFVTIGRRDFLRAAFRGGNDRLKFVGRLAAHLASAGDARLVAAAISGAREPLAQVANLAMVAHALQHAGFERALADGGWGGSRVIDFRTITECPASAALQACKALRLGLDHEDIGRNRDRHLTHHSKRPDLPYSPALREAGDNLLLSHHRDTIDAALDWAERTFGPEAALGAADRRAA